MDPRRRLRFSSKLRRLRSVRAGAACICRGQLELGAAAHVERNSICESTITTPRAMVARTPANSDWVPGDWCLALDLASACRSGQERNVIRRSSSPRYDPVRTGGLMTEI